MYANAVFGNMKLWRETFIRRNENWWLASKRGNENILAK